MLKSYVAYIISSEVHGEGCQLTETSGMADNQADVCRTVEVSFKAP